MSGSRLARALLALLVVAVLSLVPTVASAADIDTGSATPTSGIAWDPEAGVLFVASPADPGVIQMVDEDGAEVGELTFSGVPEAVTSLQWHDGQLYIADVGDPDLEREAITVFAVSAEEGQQTYRAWDFRFPDGAKHVEAFMISGRERFYFATGGSDPAFYASQLNPSREEMNTLFRAGDAPEGITDGTFLADGATMLLRTAEGVELVDAFTWEVTDATTYVGGGQDESITTFTNGRMLVGSSGVFRDEALPDGFATASPSAAPAPSSSQGSAEPEPEGSVSPTATATATASPEGGSAASAPSRDGTLVALIIAVVVSLGAGAAVYFSRH